MDVVLSRYSVEPVGSPLTALVEGCLFFCSKMISAEFIVSRDSEVVIKGWIYPSGGMPDVAEEGMLQRVTLGSR